MFGSKAKWTQITHIFWNDEYECSACGETADQPYNVCPNCGRRMAGTDYDANWVDEIELGIPIDGRKKRR